MTLNKNLVNFFQQLIPFTFVWIFFLESNECHGSFKFVYEHWHWRKKSKQPMSFVISVFVVNSVDEFRFKLKPI